MHLPQPEVVKRLIVQEVFLIQRAASHSFKKERKTIYTNVHKYILMKQDTNQIVQIVQLFGIQITVHVHCYKWLAIFNFVSRLFPW